jgi:hypothetical protein
VGTGFSLPVQVLFLCAAKSLTAKKIKSMGIRRFAVLYA